MPLLVLSRQAKAGWDEIDVRCTDSWHSNGRGGIELVQRNG